jgi:hypothetical protein
MNIDQARARLRDWGVLVKKTGTGTYEIHAPGKGEGGQMLIVAMSANEVIQFVREQQDLSTFNVGLDSGPDGRTGVEQEGGADATATQTGYPWWTQAVTDAYGMSFEQLLEDQRAAKVIPGDFKRHIAGAKATAEALGIDTSSPTEQGSNEYDSPEAAQAAATQAGPGWIPKRLPNGNYGITFKTPAAAKPTAPDRPLYFSSWEKALAWTQQAGREGYIPTIENGYITVAPGKQTTLDDEIERLVLLGDRDSLQKAIDLDIVRDELQRPRFTLGFEEAVTIALRFATTNQEAREYFQMLVGAREEFKALMAAKDQEEAIKADDVANEEALIKFQEDAAATGDPEVLAAQMEANNQIEADRLAEEALAAQIAADTAAAAGVVGTGDDIEATEAQRLATLEQERLQAAADAALLAQSEFADDILAGEPADELDRLEQERLLAAEQAAEDAALLLPSEGDRGITPGETEEERQARLQREAEQEDLRDEILTGAPAPIEPLPATDDTTANPDDATDFDADARREDEMDAILGLQVGGVPKISFNALMGKYTDISALKQKWDKWLREDDVTFADWDEKISALNNEAQARHNSEFGSQTAAQNLAAGATNAVPTPVRPNVQTQGAGTFSGAAGFTGTTEVPASGGKALLSPLLPTGEGLFTDSATTGALGGTASSDVTGNAVSFTENGQTAIDTPFTPVTSPVITAEGEEDPLDNPFGDTLFDIARLAETRDKQRTFVKKGRPTVRFR